MSRADRRKSVAFRKTHNKSLLLPMRRTEADGLVLPVRVALEALRRGHVVRHAVVCMSEVIMLTAFMTEAGHGRLDKSILDEAEMRVFALLDGSKAPVGVPADPEALEALTEIVNEYDRLLCECRLLTIVQANEYFTKLSHSVMATRERRE